MRIRLSELTRAKKRGWTLRRLALALGVEYQTILYWNQGRSLPRLPMLLKLSRFFHCRIENLIGDDRPGGGLA